MRVKGVCELLEKIAPLDKAIRGDENGIIIGSDEKNVRAIAVAWAPTIEVLNKCVQEKIDMLIVHEKLLFTPHELFKSIPLYQKVPNLNRLKAIFEGNLCIYRAHTNWDDAEGGNNDTLANELGLEITDKIQYGRVGNISQTKIKNIAQIVKEKLKAEKVIIIGDLESSVNRVAVVAGSGLRPIELCEQAFIKGAQVIISSELHDSTARYAKELGIAAIDAGCYNTENIGIKRLSERLKEVCPNDIKIVFYDTLTPYKFF